MLNTNIELNYDALNYVNVLLKSPFPFAIHFFMYACLIPLTDVLKSHVHGALHKWTNYREL